jgi:hypothetical protein
MKRKLGWDTAEWAALGCTLLLVIGCSRGAVKGPVGQGDKGLGLKVPVLDLFKKDTYDPSHFSPENFDDQEVNPLRSQKEPQPSSIGFSRYSDQSSE